MKKIKMLNKMKIANQMKNQKKKNKMKIKNLILTLSKMIIKTLNVYVKYVNMMKKSNKIQDVKVN